MTDTAIETTTITLEVTFTKVPGGLQLTDLSCEPVATGTTLGAVSAVLGVFENGFQFELGAGVDDLSFNF